MGDLPPPQNLFPQANLLLGVIEDDARYFLFPEVKESFSFFLCPFLQFEKVDVSAKKDKDEG